MVIVILVDFVPFINCNLKMAYEFHKFVSGGLTVSVFRVKIRLSKPFYHGFSVS